MAIYHYSVQVFSRSQGHSAVAAAAYRAGANLHDERTGEDHNYANRKGVIESLILAPEGAKDWAYDRSQVWNTGEANENRKDAQVAREVVVALPAELTREQRDELLTPYAQEQYVDKGMIADISYHAPDQNGDHRNYHAHILLTLRPLNEHGDGFAEKKNRDWNTKEVLLEQRQAWADHMNRALERAGIDERVDERSFVDREINRVPTTHMGKAATEMQRRDEPTRIGDENREAENWNRELAEMEQDQKIIDLAIEREKRKIAAEQTRKAALAHKAKEETLREKKTQGFQTDHVLPTLQAQRDNALHLKHLDERRALEGQIDQRRVEMQATGNRFYDPQATKGALTQAQQEAQASDTLLGRASGRHQEAQGRVEALQLNLEDIERRQAERTGFFDRNAQEQLAALDQRHQQEQQPPSPPSQDQERESEDFREYTPEAPAPRVVNDNDRSQDPEPDRGPSMEP